MDDLGEPSSYLTLKPGVPVYSSDGESLGKVEHVLADPEVDVFDGIVLDTSVLPGGHRFADAPQVEEVYDRGVVLKLTAERGRGPAGAERESRARSRPTPDDVLPEDLDDKLRRAWDRISGNY